MINQLSLLPSLAAQYTNSSQYHYRISFLNLRRYLIKFIEGNNERLIILPGLRGVGKTTLLFQLYEFIKSQKFVETDHLIYLTCDDIVKRLNSDVNEVINVYEEKIIGEAFETHKRKIIFLIDEAHYDKSWEIVAKRLYDRSQNILIFVSGSSSLALETSTDTTRRANFERVFPLNFSEYILFKENKFPPKSTSRELREAFFNSLNAKDVYDKMMPVLKNVRNKLAIEIPSFKLEFERFLSYDGFPNTLFDNEKRVYMGIINVLEKIIDQDLPRIESISKGNQTKIFPILNILASTNEAISYRTFSRDIDELSISQTTEIMNALIKAGVLDFINISSGSIRKIERKSRKYYFASPSIKAALLWNIGRFKRDNETMGLLLENGVFNSLNKTKIYTKVIQNVSYPENNGKTSDFIIQTPNGKVILECNYGLKEIKQVKKTVDSENAIYGLVVCGSEARLDEKNNIVFVPKELFFLF